MAGALISLEEDNLSDTAVAHFFCPQASQATAVELAIRGATGQDLMVSLQVDFAHSLIYLNAMPCATSHLANCCFL